MDAKSLAIKIATAQNDVITAAEKIALHFGFTAEMDAMRVNVAAAKQPGIAQILQIEGIARLLNTVAEHLVSIEPEPFDDKPKASHTDKRK